MKTILESIHALSRVCDSEEREMIEEMIFAASDYLNAVTVMEVSALNIAGRTGDALRTTVSETDRSRTNVHNKLIICVDAANRICGMHDLPPLYTGGSLRRNYGDFALALVREIFENRR